MPRHSGRHRSHGSRHRGHHHHHHHRSSRAARGCSYKYRGGTPLVATPPTSQNWVIFPYDKENNKWNTSGYLPSQTKHRASVDEIERFLAEVNEPLAAWYKEYGAVYEGGGCYLFLFILSAILIPIGIFYICWIAAAQGTAETKLDEVKEKIKLMFQEKGAFFKERGLIWNVNGYFPQWIELWCGEGVCPLMQHAQVQVNSEAIQMVEGRMMVNQQQPGMNMVSYQQSGYPQQGNGMGMEGEQNFHRGNQVVPTQQQQGFMYDGNMYGQGQAHQQFS